MTDFTDTIETTAASIEDLQQDLEAHLEDALGFGVTVTGASVESDDAYGDRLLAHVELEPLGRELERRFDADDVYIREMAIDITPTELAEGDNELEEGIRGMAREEAEDVVEESVHGDGV